MSQELLTAVLKIVAILIPIVWAIIKVKFHFDNEKNAAVMVIVEQAVNEVYLEFVREAKDKDENGKLSLEEIKIARDKAWTKALEIASSRGVNLVEEVGKEYFPVLIDKVIKSVQKNIA